ncbi:hypothetical protein WJX72_005409 [[Myrmecia] bisecta]
MCTTRTLLLRQRSQLHRHQVRCRAEERPASQLADQGPKQSQEPPQQPATSNLAVSIGIGLVYAALLGYAFFLSPNQTPFRDQYFLEKLVGVGVQDGVTINSVFSQLFLIMGVYPAIYAALLIPSARSANKIPAWPFVAVSFFLGAFALGPYFALWSPSQDVQAPPRKEELEGWKNLGLKITESRANGILLLVASLVIFGQAATAGGAAWAEYGRLFDESRFVHVTSVDFLTLSCFAPFWMYNDASARQWEPRDKLLPILSLLPVVGPAIYLVLRPRAE